MAELNLKNPTTSKHYVIALLNQAAEKGFSTRELLQAAGLPHDTLESVDRRVDTHKLAQLVQLVWDKMQDENLGFSETPCKPGTFYLMGRLTVHEPVLEKAIRLGIRYYQQVVPDYQLGLTTDGELATLTLIQKNQHLDPDHVLTELVLIAWHRYCSWLIDQDLPLAEATFNYPPPKHVDEYKFLLPTHHCFNAAQTSFSFNARFLKQAIVQSTHTLKDFMSRCPAYLFLQHRRDESLSNRVRLFLEKHLSSGLPNIEEIADHLNLTPQTLRRHLKQEGTSYQHIKDLVRCNAARYHLTEKFAPISEVAHLVGFSEPSVFVRAFKGWTGVTPSEFRNNLQ